MPSAPSPSVHLDISCLRHLIARDPTLSQVVLPSSSALSKLQQALNDLHGPGNHTHLIKLQALRTAISATFATLFVSDSSYYSDFPVVIHTVNYVLDLRLPPPIFTHEMHSTMLIAFVHAAIRWLPYVTRKDWVKHYREILDLLRSTYWSHKTKQIREVGAMEFKSAVSSVHNWSDDPLKLRTRPEGFVRGFEKRYPFRKLRFSLQQHINWLDSQLPDLQVVPAGLRRQKLQRPPKVVDVDKLPEFFSDAEYDVKMEEHMEGSFSPMRSDEENDADEEEENRFIHERGDLEWTKERKASGRQKRAGRSSKGSAGRSPEERLPRRSPRKRKEINFDESSDEVDSQDEAEDDESEDEYDEDSESMEDEYEEGAELEDRAVGNGEGEGSKGDARDRIAEEVDSAGLRELDQVESDAFYGSDDPSQVTHVARTKRSRRASAKRCRPTGQKFNPVNKDSVEQSNGIRDVNNDSEADDDESEEEEHDVGQVRGPQGEALRQLRDAAAGLTRRACLTDPLPKSIREARRARPTVRRSSSRMYTPAPNARVASPIPDSETPISRKRTRRLNLDSDSEDFARNGRRVRRKGPPTYYGKILKTGRFQPFEDELLKAGLKKYGWGAWTDIAKNFGKGTHTRAPMSLKDRARTLELNPHKYREPAHKRGRPPVRKVQKQNGAPDEEIDEEVEAANADGSAAEK